MIEKLQIAKTRNVKTPTRGTAVAAGLDFYVPEDLTKEDILEMEKKTGHELIVDFNENGFMKSMQIGFGQSACIPSGIKAKLPDGYCMEFHNKSGIACKRGLMAGSCVVGNTLIETNKGLFSADTLTKDFCEKNDILINSWNKAAKKTEYKACCGFKPTKTVKCIHVVFEDGTEVTGAEDHFVYDKDEMRWVPLCEFIK